MNRSGGFFLVCWLAALMAPALWAGPDDTQQGWLELAARSPRWDNIEGAPQWLDGSSPRWRWNRSLHMIDPKPGETATLRVPAGEQLRLYRPDGQLRKGDFEFAWSNGSGLYLVDDGRLTQDGHSLVSAPLVAGESVVRITRRAPSKESFEIALFISRDINSLTAPTYRETLSPGTAGQAVAIADRNESATYWTVDRDRPLSLEMEGETRIEIQSRLLFPNAGAGFTDSYRVYAYLDGKPWRAMDLATHLDTASAPEIDGCLQPLGRRALSYLDIPPEKHRLQLRSHRPLYLRPLARKRPDDYLYDRNRPLDYEHTVGRPGKHSGVSGFWEGPLEETQQAQEGATWPSAMAFDAAVRVSKDNSRRFGGLLGAMTLRDWAARYPRQQPYADIATRRFLAHTFYRNLLPERGVAGRDPLFAWFPTPRLQEDARPVLLPDTYAQPLLDTLASGYFASLPLAGKRIFPLPERGAPSLLRVSVDHAELKASETLYLQFDDADPLKLRVDKVINLPADSFRPSLRALALSVLERQHKVRGGTLSGPFALGRWPAPLASGVYAEIALPASVRKIRVWREGRAEQAVRIALAYRASRPFELSETELLKRVATLGQGRTYRWFRSALIRATDGDDGAGGWALPGVARGDEATQDMLSDLYNDWLPLLRFIRSRHDRFAASVRHVGNVNQGVQAIDPSRLQTLKDRARIAEQSQDWVLALETWREIWGASQGEAREQARFAQNETLQRLGNRFLAQQMLRHDFLYGERAEFRERALQRLLELHQREGDLEGELTLRATALFNDPRPSRLRGFAQALLTQGRTRFALQLLIALPPEERAESLLLEAAYSEGWWQLFEQTLQALADPLQRERWQGYRAQRHGDYGKARDHWEQMGEPGAALVGRLEAGLAIGQALAASDPAAREAAVLRWERWQEKPLSRQVWKDEPQAVNGHDGAGLIYAVDQDRYLKAFRASPRKPLSVSVYGPATVRFRVRALHRIGDDAFVNDWIMVGEEGRERNYPVIDNRVSASLRLVGQPDVRLGQAVEVLYAVPPGHHTVRLRTERTEVLAEFASLRAQLPFAVLPPLTPHTVQAALAGELGREVLPSDYKRVGSRSVRTCGPVEIFTSEAAHIKPMPLELQTATNPFLGLAKRRAGWIPRSAESEGLPGDGADSRLSGKSDRTKLDRLRALLWQAEHDPARYLSYLVAAETLVLEGAVPGAESILRRLRKPASWERVRSQESAGVHLIELHGWRPEDPGLRVRKALFIKDGLSDQVLTGHEEMVLSVNNLRANEFLFHLSIEDLGYQPSLPMQVLIRLDEEPEQAVLLRNGESGVSVNQRVGVGRHVLRVRIAQPVVNQYLRVQIRERRGKGSAIVAEPVSRGYDVATPKQPLGLFIEGPTLLRIDEWRGGYTQSRYLTVAQGWQELKIPVETDRREALLRVYRLRLDRDKPAVAARPDTSVTKAVAGPLWQAWEPFLTSAQPVRDALPLGGQEDGTWSLLGQAVSRRWAEDDERATREPERFFELGAAYRYFAEHQEVYYHGDVRYRFREQGDPTAAIRGWIDVRRREWPIDLTVDGSLFLQHLDATDRIESAATLRARVWKRMELGPKIAHRPFATLFKRWLTLSDSRDLDTRKVDQDVFTRYKNEHQNGLRVGDLISYRPWLDTLFYSSASVTSNEDMRVFDPDHLRVRFGAQQLIGAFDVGVSYSWYRYFEDDDRKNTFSRQRPRLDLGYIGWPSARSGIAANLRYEYDNDSGSSSVWLGLAWNWANGRDYRDYRPGELNLPSLRRRRVHELRAVSESE
jgi:hypothetical protein